VAVYGLQDDVLANQGKGVQLYIPGQTRLTSQDIFLGGPGTGIDDNQLNGATRIHADTAEATANGFDKYMENMKNGVPVKTADNQVSNSSPRTYGLQADVDANAGKNVSLFTPGKTKLNSNDIFLGGPGTGVKDDELGGARRIYGNSTGDTANAYTDYNNNLATRIKSAISANYAPREDAEMGMPTLARQTLEAQQAQNIMNNKFDYAGYTGNLDGKSTLQQRAYDHNVGQDDIANRYNQDKFDYSKEQDSIANAMKQAQFDAENQYRNNALAASQARSSGGSRPSVSELNYQDKQNSQQVTAQAMSKLQEKANLGWTRDQVLNWMYSNSNAFMSAGVDMDNLAKLASSAYTWNGEDESRYK